MLESTPRNDVRAVEFLQGDVVTAVYFRDELAKVPVYGTVAVVCSLHAAVSHFLDELLVVLLEELQQRLAFHAQPEAGVPQPGGGSVPGNGGSRPRVSGQPPH